MIFLDVGQSATCSADKSIVPGYDFMFAGTFFHCQSKMIANKHISIHKAYIFIYSGDNMPKSQCIQKSADPPMNRVDHCDYKLRCGGKNP